MTLKFGLVFIYQKKEKNGYRASYGYTASDPRYPNPILSVEKKPTSNKDIHIPTL